MGKSEFRLVQAEGRFHGLVDGKRTTEADTEEKAWQSLIEARGAEQRRYFGMAGARSLFLRHYPNGFHSVGFNERGERGYKEKAKALLEAMAPVEAALDATGLGEAVLAAFNATNLKSIYGKMRIKDVLRSKDADRFIQAAARFAVGDKRETALREMERVLRPHNAAKWTSVTYLPFLWRPESHMFLKPESTLDFAERTGHPFASAYSPALDMRTYDKLLDLASKTYEAIADLEPRDNIDIQSFIWVVSGAYDGEVPRP